jgi:hypothetical protein
MMHGLEESDSVVMLRTTSWRLCCPGFYVRGGVADEES